jgi:hypothetical protein
MAWKFRKRMKIAPGVTLNLTGKNAGFTLGNRFMRVSANTNGNITTGQSIPGSGLYRQQVTQIDKGAQPSKRRQGSTPTTQAPTNSRSGCLTRIVKWGVGLFALLIACGALMNLFPNAPTDQRTADPQITVAPIALASPTTEPISQQPVVEQRSDAVVLPDALPTATELPATAPVELPTATLPLPTNTSVPPTPAPTNTPEPPTATPEPAGPVANAAANVREGPGTDYGVVVVAEPGQVMVVTGQDSSGQWLQLASGYWIAASLVDNIPPNLPVTAVVAQLPGGNPTPMPTSAPAQEAAPTSTPSWQREERGIIFTSECPCDQGDILNCDSFGINMDAQACYMRCMDLAGRDVHGLDRDKDGTACEWSW